MNKFLCIALILFISSGCSTVSSKNLPPHSNALPQNKKIEATKVEVKPIVSDGIIFGKADFQGVLKVEYVKLMIVDENAPDKVYELFFGERNEEQSLFGSTRSVEPNYFFLELPASKYRIESISIPVGTTLATEKTDIAFTVEKETVIYLGTLRVIGTDQKIRFGAIPIIRPGFDYKIEILDEKDEALKEFRSRYPFWKSDIQIKPMKNLHIQAY